MTEKQYKSIGANLKCPNGMEYMLIKRNDGVNVCQVCSKYTAKEIVDELNSLADDNEQLKQEIKNLRDFRGFITEKNVENEQQRKELQLQMLRLYNYFEDYFEDEMSPTAFSEMWDNVKESEKWDKKR